MLSNLKEQTNWPNQQDGEMQGWLRTLVRLEFAALLAVVATCIAWAYFARLAGPKTSISYTGGPMIKVPQGPTLLEISRMYRVPHASICGGRARCSTCRVRIERGSNDLPPPGFPEAITLGKIGAPPSVRLACQIRPEGRLFVARLLNAATTGPDAVDLDEADSAGVEKRLVVMFVDLRAFTRLSENRLPFDIVYILNEFFGVVGTTIAAHGGWIDKFLGDGLLAVFGQHDGFQTGCRKALRAARTIDFTVIGTTVNIASRLEGLAKEKGFQIMLTRDVARKASWEPSTEFTMTVDVRGVGEPVEVIGIPRGRDLASNILALSDEDKPTHKPRGWIQGIWRGA